jgi:hypothetical protein
VRHELLIHHEPEEASREFAYFLVSPLLCISASPKEINEELMNPDNFEQKIIKIP